MRGTATQASQLDDAQGIGSAPPSYAYRICRALADPLPQPKFKAETELHLRGTEPWRLAISVVGGITAGAEARRTDRPGECRAPRRVTRGRFGAPLAQSS
jgi:hypothetical protein